MPSCNKKNLTESVEAYQHSTHTYTVYIRVYTVFVDKFRRRANVDNMVSTSDLFVQDVA